MSYGLGQVNSKRIRGGKTLFHKPARLMAIIPADLPAGTYYIEVRTKFIDASKTSKTLKTGRFAKPLNATA